MTDMTIAPSDLDKAQAALTRARETLSTQRARWPEVREIRRLRVAQREENHYGPSVRKMMGL